MSHLVPELNRLQDTGEIQVLVIHNGATEAVRRWLKEIRPRFSVAVQERFSLSKRYEVFATPFAFLIDERGVIAARGIVSTKQYLGFVLTRAPDSMRRRATAKPRRRTSPKDRRRTTASHRVPTQRSLIMFEKIGRYAEKLAAGAGQTRRGFLGLTSKGALSLASLVGGLLLVQGEAVADKSTCTGGCRYKCPDGSFISGGCTNVCNCEHDQKPWRHDMQPF